MSNNIVAALFAFPLYIVGSEILKHYLPEVWQPLSFAVAAIALGVSIQMKYGGKEK